MTVIESESDGAYENELQVTKHKALVRLKVSKDVKSHPL